VSYATLSIGEREYADRERDAEQEKPRAHHQFETTTVVAIPRPLSYAYLRLANTYTFILEFRGGTYVSQYRARSVSTALLRWSATEKQNLKSLDPAASRFLTKLESAEPVLLSGLRNVWCVTGYMPSTLALLHIVKTVPTGSIGKKARAG
jgi:hypothetical protein